MTQSQYLRGAHIDPRPITGRETVRELRSKAKIEWVP